MQRNRCIGKWSEGKPVLGITLHLKDPSVYELTSLLGFDLIWIDLEHHAHSLESVSEFMRASRVGNSDILTRPGKGEFNKMARLLEAGSNGIMYPRCDSVLEAKQVVQQMKFPPLGGRGLDGSGPDALYGTLPLDMYLEKANKETFLLIQIEDSQGLSVAYDIAKVEGVDMIFFGPGDYSLQEGFPGNFQDPRYWEAIEKMAQSAEMAGKMWGTPAFSLEHAEKLLGMGAMLITYSSDMTLLRKRLRNIQEEFQSLGFRFS